MRDLRPPVSGHDPAAIHWQVEIGPFRRVYGQHIRLAPRLVAQDDVRDVGGRQHALRLALAQVEVAELWRRRRIGEPFRSGPVVKQYDVARIVVVAAGFDPEQVDVVDPVAAVTAPVAVADVGLLSITCAHVHSVLFLPRAVLLTVLVPDRRHFPASRRRQASGSATRYRLARLG